mmetsp:Transcript_130338/g.236956  ORF Transcript_130338/g.236956 Transcript_130338/m.236956 type:complete len:864 (+) Transcript_130338:199-2790(+)
MQSPMQGCAVRVLIAAARGSRRQARCLSTSCSRWAPGDPAVSSKSSPGEVCELGLFHNLSRNEQRRFTPCHRDISAQLTTELKRRWSRFDIPQVPGGASSMDPDAVQVDPLDLFRRLQRKPNQKPVTAQVCENLLVQYERRLQKLTSPVIDVQMPSSGVDPRIVIIGDTHGQLIDVLHIIESQGLPSEEVIYIFNGDIVDRGRYAVEIWLLAIVFKLKYPSSVHVLRGNHENDQMISRPFKIGGGFAEECLSKYGRGVLAVFRRIFKLLPLFAVVAEEVFLVHGGLFRSRDVTLARLRDLPLSSWQRNYPNPLSKEEVEDGLRWSEEEEILFDAQWADPHYGKGTKISSRGRAANTFGEDVTQQFLDEADLSMVIRSHRVPASGLGFEFEHDDRLLTVFSASRYGGVMRNRGAIGVLRRAATESLASSPLQQLRLSIVEHELDPKKGSQVIKEDLNASHLVEQIRNLVARQATEYQEDTAQSAFGRICMDREELWRRCHESDAAASGLIPRETLCSILSSVCGEFNWDDLLQRFAPHLGRDVAYTELLGAPRVRWFYLGKSHVVSLAQAAMQGNFPLNGVLTLLDSRHDGVVRPDATREVLRRLLPSMQDHQRERLASEIFGDETSEVTSVLHQLVMLADPIQLEEEWMQGAFLRLAKLTQRRYGKPLARGLRRWFRQIDENHDEHAEVDHLVKGWVHIGATKLSGEDEVPLDEDNLLKLGKAIQLSRPAYAQSAPVSYPELLRVLDPSPRRPEFPGFPAIEGSVAALLFSHKVKMLHSCRMLDQQETGQISAKNFVELTSTLASVVGRPLTGAVKAALESELQDEVISYMDALSSFEVFAEGGPWTLGFVPANSLPHRLDLE